MNLELFRQRYPWPDYRPLSNMPDDWFGWLAAQTAEMLFANLSADTKLVVECGSFLGVSAHAILTAAPNVHLICVDTWRGSPEHVSENAPVAWSSRIPKLYEGFLHNLWPWRDRVTPLRADSLDGLAEIHATGLSPELIYLDTAHTFERVSAELEVCFSDFPTAAIVGDDFNNGNVAEAVEFRRSLTNRMFTCNETAFCFHGETL